MLKKIDVEVMVDSTVYRARVTLKLVGREDDSGDNDWTISAIDDVVFRTESGIWDYPTGRIPQHVVGALLDEAVAGA